MANNLDCDSQYWQKCGAKCTIKIHPAGGRVHWNKTLKSNFALYSNGEDVCPLQPAI